MHVTPLELGLVVVAACVFFGPKRLPKLSAANSAAIANAKVSNQAKPLVPAYYAAARAPSPLSMRFASSPRDVAPEYQFAFVDASSPTPKLQPAPLPHEFYWR
jgi:hypothetical protein